MKRLLTRLWNLLRSRILRWIGEEGTGRSPFDPSLPADIATLRNQAAALSAIAARTRMEIASLLDRYDRLDAAARQALLESREADARHPLSEMTEVEAEIARRLEPYDAQRRASEAAVDLYHRSQAEWLEARARLSEVEGMERLTGRLASSSNPASSPNAHEDRTMAQPAGSPSHLSEPTTDATSLPAIAAAREMLKHPPLSERTSP